MALFIALQNRNYRLFWSGQIISVSGTWMQSTALAWLVLQISHQSAFQLGLVGALQSVPVLLLTLVAGTLADRWPKHRLLIVTKGAALVQALLLWVLVATGNIQLWEVYLLALLLGLINTLDTPTRHAFAFELVGPDRLTNAIALTSSLSNLARIVGPAAAGVLIAAFGVAPVFLINALSYVPVLLGLGLIRGGELFTAPLVPEEERQTPLRKLREGVSYMAASPVMLWLVVVVGVVLFLGSNFNVILPLFATEVLHLGARGFGFLSASAGAGAMLASLWLAWSNVRPTLRRVLVGIILFGLAEAGFALSGFAAVSLILIAAVAAAEEVFATLTITRLQQLAPGRLRGRISSVYLFVFNGSVPLGYLMVGWLAGRFGPSHALLLLALVCLAAAAAGRVWRGQTWA
ncbi:MAG: MFS transporter [Chloroflexota bacterium]